MICPESMNDLFPGFCCLVDRYRFASMPGVRLLSPAPFSFRNQALSRALIFHSDGHLTGFLIVSCSWEWLSGSQLVEGLYG